MKSSQLIGCNVRNTFLESQVLKYSTECRRETISRPFNKKLKSNISLNQQSQVLYSLFLLLTKLKDIKIDHLLLPHLNLFLKKRDLQFVPLPNFLNDFFNKNRSLVICY